jgi:hypothetical protein
MTADLEALVVAAYVFANEYPVPARPGRPARVSDAELVALAVCQAASGVCSDRQFLGLVGRILPGWFPHLPSQSQYNRRLRVLVEPIAAVQQRLARWLDTGDVRLADGTLLACASYPGCAARSEFAGFARYGYQKSHHRFLWGVRLVLLTDPRGLPLGYTLVPRWLCHALARRPRRGCRARVCPGARRSSDGGRVAPLGAAGTRRARPRRRPDVGPRRARHGAVRHEAVPSEAEPPGAFETIVGEAVDHPLLHAHAARRRPALRLSEAVEPRRLSHSEFYGDLLHRSGVEYGIRSASVRGLVRWSSQASAVPSVGSPSATATSSISCAPASRTP